MEIAMPVASKNLRVSLQGLRAESASKGVNLLLELTIGGFVALELIGLLTTATDDQF
jgi:hypothetical protein